MYGSFHRLGFYLVFVLVLVIFVNLHTAYASSSYDVTYSSYKCQSNTWVKDGAGEVLATIGVDISPGSLSETGSFNLYLPVNFSAAISAEVPAVVASVSNQVYDVSLQPMGAAVVSPNGINTYREYKVNVEPASDITHDGKFYLKLSSLHIPEGANGEVYIIFDATDSPFSSADLIICIAASELQPPTWPNPNFTATRNNGSIILQWNPATDNVGIDTYEILVPFMNSVRELASVDGNTTSYVITSGYINTRHSYYLQAVDLAGNRSSILSVSLEATNLPLISEYALCSYDPASNETLPYAIGPVHLSGPLTQVPCSFSNNIGIGISFAKNVTDDSCFSGNQTAFQLLDAANNNINIKVDRSGDGNLYYNSNGNKLFVIPQVTLQPASTYKIIIAPTLIDIDGAQAGVQQEINFTTAPDTTAVPTWPNGASLTAANVKPTEVTLNWSAATADVAVTRYTILKKELIGGMLGSFTTIDLLGTSMGNVDGNTLSYNVTGLLPDDQYEFRIIAVDAAHNWSVPGPTISVRTSLPKPTATPRGGAVVSGTQVTLSTTAPLAQIYYTLDDGTLPFPITRIYTGPITINAPVTIEAVSKAYNHSEVMTESYTIAEPITTSTVNVANDGSNKDLAITQDTVNMNTPVTISVPPAVNDAKISVTALVNQPDNNGNVTTDALPEMVIEKMDSSISSTTPVQVNIPAGTAVSAASDWNGNINVPAVQANNSVTVTPDSGKTATVNTVIEIGSGDVPLFFNKAVRILIPGQAGKEVGYTRNGVFTKITTVMSADTQAAGDALPAGEDGKIDVGSDLVVWTKHFTKYVTYTQSNVSSGSGSITGKYTVNPTLDTVYTCSKTISGIDAMTVNSGINGLKYFTVNITPVIEHPGIEKAVFVQLSEGTQIDLNVTGADFDTVHSAQAGFYVKPADVVKVYIVDDLTNDIDVNPTVLE